MKNQKFASHLVRRISWDELDPKYLEHLVRTARSEDIEGAGLLELPKFAADVTTLTITPDANIETRLCAREDMCVCGMKLVPVILEVYASYCGGAPFAFEPLSKDGDRVCAGAVLGRISGRARLLLQAERVMLNFLQRLSGVATATAKYIDALGSSDALLLDTRKTTPSLRVLEKYAFACGGGHTHRMGLFDRVMLKDNHLVAAHAVSGEMLAEAVALAKKKYPELAVEVEVDSIEQIYPVLDAKADVIMLDNFDIENISKAVDIIGDLAWIEASGGITLKNLRQIADTGVDFISTAAPVHSSKWIDIGLDS